MTDDPKEAIPAFKFTEKKVDDSWKEEVRKEREAAAARAAALKAPPAPAASVPPSGKATFDTPEPTASESAPEAPAAPPTTPMSPQEQQQTKIFMAFLEQMAQQALMQMGEMENPYSGQAEMDLQGAKFTLELLAMFQAKTKGNLNDVENKALTGILADLKKHFAVIAQEMQRQMAAQMAQRGDLKPGPGGTIR